MCGIFGFIENKSGYCFSQDERLDKLKAMGDSIKHRGPDNYSTYTHNNISLGHQRLSIIDLTEAGNQPMVSRSNRYVIAFNGEIYNFKDLKNELKDDYDFKSSSDTEVFLAGLEKWGLENTLKKSVGMFAIALYDKKENKIFFARDRVGKKPLYYGFIESKMVFASELKPFTKIGSGNLNIDLKSLQLYTKFSYIPSPRSIFKNISKLNSACYIEFSIDNFKFSKPIRYWNAVEISQRRKIDITFLDAQHQLENILHKAVEQRMISDVPIGAMLSGGIDSSLVVSIMQKLSSRPIHTFSIGVDNPGFNEAQHAKKIAQHLGTSHEELYISEKQLLSVIPNISEIYDEPFADSSQIPTYLVSKLARKSVTVALSGDGGDELFGGYNRYLQSQAIWKYLQHIPYSLRHFSRSIIHLFPISVWDVLLRNFASGIPYIGDKFYKLAGIIDTQTDDEMYLKLTSIWQDEDKVTKIYENLNKDLEKKIQWSVNNNLPEKMMLADLLTYLQDDILVKVDRASMANSLEARSPLLDHRIIEFALQLPVNYKIQDKKGKVLLKNILYKYVPKDLIERPKMGFSIPINEWLRGPLKEWGNYHLNRNRLKADGFFNEEFIEKKWEEHQSGKRNWHYQLWNIIIFQQWKENFLG